MIAAASCPAQPCAVAAPNNSMPSRSRARSLSPSDFAYSRDRFRELIESALATARTLGASDAVAEVVKSAREAQSQVLDAVRQGLRSAQDLAKSATDRFLAALVGTGAVTIAHASKRPRDHGSQDPMAQGAGFLGA